MLDFQEIKNKHSMDIKGVIHVGAHKGEEISDYVNIPNLMFFEPIPELYRVLNDNCNKRNGVITYEMALSNKNGNADFFVTNHTMSSSLLKLKHHKIIEPNVKEVKTIKVRINRFDSLVVSDGINMNDYNFLVMDTQGSELMVLEGFGKYIDNIDYIITEINREELYDGCALEKDIDEFLINKNGFVKKDELFPVPSWGDILYIRNTQ